MICWRYFETANSFKRCERRHNTRDIVKGVIEVEPQDIGRRHFAPQSRPRQELPQNQSRSNASRRVERHCQHHHQTTSIASHIRSCISLVIIIQMSEPPRKRRKSSSPLQTPSSPLRKSPRRPSFASPTKASLARNYPNLLSTRKSPRDDIRAQGKGAYALVRGAYNTLPKELERTSDDAESLATPSQRRLEEQEGPGRGIVFSSTGKRPSRAPSVLKKSSLVKVPAAQQAQPTQPVEEASDVDGSRQTKKANRRPFDPEVEKRKQEKARLQREVQELEAQVSRCTNEILAEQQRGINDALLPTQRADLM